VKTTASDENFVDDYLPALLAQASQLISSEFHQVVKAHRMTVSEWRVLASLAGGKALSTSQLALVSVTKGPTATRLLDRLVDRELVQRLSDSSDRRVTLIKITPKGQKTVSRLMTLAREHERRVLEPFGLEQAEQLKAILRQLIQLHWRGGDDAGDSPQA
jgi:DNA-binding MarR family transcriptional regulator